MGISWLVPGWEQSTCLQEHMARSLLYISLRYHDTFSIFDINASLEPLCINSPFLLACFPNIHVCCLIYYTSDLIAGVIWDVWPSNPNMKKCTSISAQSLFYYPKVQLCHAPPNIRPWLVFESRSCVTASNLPKILNVVFGLFSCLECSVISHGLLKSVTTRFQVTTSDN